MLHWIKSVDIQTLPISPRDEIRIESKLGESW